MGGGGQSRRAKENLHTLESGFATNSRFSQERTLKIFTYTSQNPPKKTKTIQNDALLMSYFEV